MDNPWIAAATALFLWWFSTGILLMRVRAADNRGHDAHIWSCLLTLPVLAAGIIGINETAADASPTGAFVAFVSALAVWGWIELAFLSGLITGPNRRPCPPGTTATDRFLRGFGTVAWHELALVAALVVLAQLTQGAANPFGFWTFAVLFFARVSAKLNLFFGVPRIHTEFLPRTLAHLPSHFRRGPMTPFFPLSVSLLTFAAYCFLERLAQAGSPGAVTGFALLSALTLLALLEHWFMVLPLPDQKLWRWMLPAPKPLPKD
ncbi:MAG TPA: putative photosynthetic complex assembly protein PuhE [Paracoccaceae bacterium]|nr:putative photosynthetic complex assembly protein PuhE [Paracoccaceae bacterium]HMO70423.1 putative photosynthetic complex assembly protein PuhE [Paracoccaceae bacterium]